MNGRLWQIGLSLSSLNSPEQMIRKMICLCFKWQPYHRRSSRLFEVNLVLLCLPTSSTELFSPSLKHSSFGFPDTAVLLNVLLVICPSLCTFMLFYSYSNSWMSSGLGPSFLLTLPFFFFFLLQDSIFP